MSSSGCGTAVRSEHFSRHDTRTRKQPAGTFSFMSVQASDGGQSGPEDFERELRRALYRFDCPDAHTLGEYQMDLLDQKQRMQGAAHAAECDECRGAVQTLRTCLAAPVAMAESG